MPSDRLDNKLNFGMGSCIALTSSIYSAAPKRSARSRSLWDYFLFILIIILLLPRSKKVGKGKKKRREEGKTQIKRRENARKSLLSP
jgi:hypothetical protein